MDCWCLLLSYLPCVTVSVKLPDLINLNKFWDFTIAITLFMLKLKPCSGYENFCEPLE